MHGTNQSLPLILEGNANAPNRLVQRVLVDHAVRPRGFQQFVLGDDFASVAKQINQDFDAGAVQRNIDPHLRKAVMTGINTKGREVPRTAAIAGFVRIHT